MNDRPDPRPEPRKADALHLFSTEMAEREKELLSVLPGNIAINTFRNVAIIAVKRSPELLDCDRRSLHNAVTAAAFDGLMPDGKEGVILPAKEKSEETDERGVKREVWRKVARWQPMVHGIRKRARELDDIVIDCKVVHANDVFDWEEGDNPHIRHQPTPLGDDPGDMIGAFAIFRKGPDILHREVMRKSSIEAVKKISKQPNGLMWSQFTEEAWKKSALRRGIKTVPCTEALRTIVERFDDLHDVRDALQKPAPPLSPLPPPRPALVAIKGGVSEADIVSFDFEGLRGALASAESLSEIEQVEKDFAGRLNTATTLDREQAVALIVNAKKGE